MARVLEVSASLNGDWVRAREMSESVGAEGEMAQDDGSFSGVDDWRCSLSWFRAARACARSFFSFARRFWNQTWTSRGVMVRRMESSDLVAASGLSVDLNCSSRILV